MVATYVVFLSFLTRTKRRKMAFFGESREGVREGLAWRSGVQGLRLRGGRW